MQKPKPLTKSAWLVSAGIVAIPTATKHVYVETVLVDRGWSHVFECTVTRARRGWGLESI